jgi:hypothetical protein
MKTAISIAAVGGIVLIVAAFTMADGAPQRDAANYLGMQKCSMCHGPAKKVWVSSPHAKAFEILGTDEAKAVAKKLGIDDPQKSGKCLKCHSTAYNFTEMVANNTLDVKEGVSCESCHGPGAKYKAMSVMKDKTKAIEAGLVSPPSQSCALCHNDQSPTWKADRFTTKDGKKVGFDFDQAFEKIKHGLH